MNIPVDNTLPQAPVDTVDVDNTSADAPKNGGIVNVNTVNSADTNHGLQVEPDLAAAMDAAWGEI